MPIVQAILSGEFHDSETIAKVGQPPPRLAPKERARTWGTGGIVSRPLKIAGGGAGSEGVPFQ